MTKQIVLKQKQAKIQQALNLAIVRRRRKIRNILVITAILVLGVSFMPLMPILMGEGGAEEFLQTVIFYACLLCIIGFSEPFSRVAEYAFRTAMVNDSEYKHLRQYR